MALAWLSQLILLMKKNFILQMRRPKGTFFEILIPFLLTCTLLIARFTLDEEQVCFSTFKPGFVEEGTDFGFGQLDIEKLLPCLENGTDCPVLVYYPKNNLTTELFNSFAILAGAGALANLPFEISDEDFASEEELAMVVAEEPEQYFGAIIFNIDPEATSFPKEMSYRIRLHHEIVPGYPSNTWFTRRIYPSSQDTGPRTSNVYKTRFLLLQHAIDRLITIAQISDETAQNRYLAGANYQIQQYPYPSYIDDGFIAAIEFMLPFILCISFIYSAGTITKEIVFEKEMRLKESMKMMGLANWIHWLAWFLKSFLFLLIPVVLIVILFTVGRLFQFTDIFVFLVFLVMWILSAISWNFAISVIFTNARLGLIFSMVLWYVSYIPANFFDIDTTSVPILLLMCLLPNSCLTFGVQIIARYESKGRALDWSMVSVSPSVDGSFTLFYAYIMFAVDCVVFFLFTWYIEAVFPGKYGIPKPFYFPFQPSYWCGVKPRGPSGRSITPDNIEITGVPDEEENHESAPSMEEGIVIKNLTKVYKSAVGKKMAVDDLSMKMYKGQITALLGHNGAGKTTTMSILTGLFPPTTGSATVNGHDVATNIEGVRSSLGLCPQHNVLFDRLTVKEHMEFFIKLKGKSGRAADQEVKQMIEDLQLVDKTNAQAQTLSGGMKRKLSCAVALIGGSEIVILDEPTSGMDPYARRATWELLLKYKAGKTMVLTTHFMDEADLLGDRIAIMANGQLITSGSSLFLKNKFGVGYHLTFVRDEKCDIDNLNGFVQRRIPEAHMQSCLAREVDYILPIDKTSQFKDLFMSLEENREKLGVTSFGVSVTTMEEVFMKVGDLAEEAQSGKEGFDNPSWAGENGDISEENGSRNGHANGKTNGTANGASSKPANGAMYRPANGAVTLNMTSMGVSDGEYLTGAKLKLTQFTAIFHKRLICAIRDPKSWILQIVLPVLFVLLGLIIAKTGTRLEPDPPRELTLTNISDVSPGGSAIAFIADLRANRSPPNPNYFQKLESVLDGMNMEYTDITQEVLALYNDNQDGLVKGEPYSEVTDCCHYPNLILSSNCSELFNEDGRIENTCADYDDFGYNMCPNCMASVSSSNDSVCTAEPIDGKLDDMSTFFEEYILEESRQQDFYFEKYIAGFTLQDQTVTILGMPLTLTLAKGWYSNQAYHTSPEVLNALDAAILKYFTDDSYSLSVTNHPLPLATSTSASNSGADPDTFNLAILILYGMSFLTASFLPFIISERSSKAKHLQLVSGLDRVTYWVANYCWDFVNFMVVFAVLVAVFAAFQVESLSGENLGAVAVTLALFGWASIPFVYLVSTFFKSSVNGYAITTIILAILGMAFVITIFVVQAVVENELIGQILDHIFMVLPTYAMTRAILLLTTNFAIRDICTVSVTQEEVCSTAGITFERNNFAWDMPGIGQPLIYLVIEGIVFFIIVLFSEYFSLSSLCGSMFKTDPAVPQIEDEDVARERERVHSMDRHSEDQAVLVDNLHKTYYGSDRPAVKNLCLAIPRGECFGLLGVNGAGKTTTFGMLTGDVEISSGHAYIQGHSIRSDRRQAQRFMGYCPQFDALVERLTGRETLTMFARLRGIPSSNIPAVVKHTIEHLDLVKYADKLCGNYSGGNKRKLSTAIALVGSPPVVLLDEPTSGMDPKARRHLWNAILSVMRDGKSVVLTSHSMEECEALCTRLAIMVNGEFKCLGSIQHLKSRFGKGYTMILKVEGQDTEPIQNFVRQNFPGAELLEIHQGTLRFHVSDENMNWSRIFGTLEDSKESLGISFYSVSQTPLEQVFINFAKDQFEETKTRKRCCCCFC